MPRKKKREVNPYTPLVAASSLVFKSTEGQKSNSGQNMSEQCDSGSSSPVNSLSTNDFDGAQKEGDGDVSSLLSDLKLDEEAKELFPPRVLYFGWFFKSEVCTALKEISVAYLQQCYFAVEEFEQFLRRNGEKKGIRDSLELYQYPDRGKTGELPDYHVTAKYCARERRPTEEYGKEVSHLVGTETDIQIVGLYFTERTYGFRVKLTPEQAELFDERTFSSSRSGKKVETHFSSKTPQKNQSKEKLRPPKELVTMESDYHPKIRLASQEPDFNPTTSRAHITIGCAPNVKAFIAGEDLMDLVSLETRLASIFTKDYTLANGDVLRQFGRFGDAFILYLNQKFIVNAEFNFKP